MLNCGAPTESLESFTRYMMYPFALNGPSSSGKTVAALQLAEVYGPTVAPNDMSRIKR